MGNWNPNYFEKKSGSLEEAILNAVNGVKTQINEKKLDPVNKDAAKKKFDDRKDKDIDNDGDVDSSDKYLHKRRKAIGKAMKSEATPGSMDYQRYIQGLKQQLRDVMRNDGSPAEADELEDRIEKAIKRDREASRPDTKRESYGMNEATGKDIAKKMMGSKTMKGFASKVAKMKSVTKGDLENMLPDYVNGADISKLFEAQDGGDFKTHMMYDPKTGKGYEAKTMEDHLRMKKMGYDHKKPNSESFESQGEADWNETVSIIQKKQTSMREALAKVWGFDEGHNPFKKEEKVPKGFHRMPDGSLMKDSDMDKKENKTMTGKSATKVTVDPDMKKD